MILRKFLFLGCGILLFASCNKEGCTDPNATNYNPNAANDDGSCNYSGDNPNFNLAGTEETNRTIKNRVDGAAWDYYIDGTWTINSEITIEPGVRIMMKAGSNIDIQDNGSLNATGLENKTIDIYGQQDIEGYWGHILVQSNNNNNRFIYCNISDGGTGIWGSGVISLVSNSRARIQNSNFKNASNIGIEVKNKDARLIDFHSNTFSNIQSYPISFATLLQAGSLDDSNIYGSGINMKKVRIEGYSYASSVTINKISIPYLIEGWAYIENGVTEISAGTVLAMGPSSGLIIDTEGALSLLGTPSDRVKLQGNQSSKGYWGGLYFTSNNPNNIISYTDISDGSDDGGIWTDAVVYLSSSSSLSMDNTHISNCSRVAINRTNETAIFNDNGGNSWSNCDEGGGLLP